MNHEDVALLYSRHEIGRNIGPVPKAIGDFGHPVFEMQHSHRHSLVAAGRAAIVVERTLPISVEVAHR